MMNLPIFSNKLMFNLALNKAFRIITWIDIIQLNKLIREFLLVLMFWKFTGLEDYVRLLQNLFLLGSSFIVTGNYCAAFVKRSYTLLLYLSGDRLFWPVLSDLLLILVVFYWGLLLLYYFLIFTYPMLWSSDEILW